MTKEFWFWRTVKWVGHAEAGWLDELAKGTAGHSKRKEMSNWICFNYLWGLIRVFYFLKGWLKSSRGSWFCFFLRRNENPSIRIISFRWNMNIIQISPVINLNITAVLVPQYYSNQLWRRLTFLTKGYNICIGKGYLNRPVTMLCNYVML